MNNTAIILAGGIGKRMGKKIPKQFIRVNNKMIIEYSINQFISNKKINDIIIVVEKKWVKKIKKKYPMLVVLCGGRNRKESSFIGLMACNHKTQNVLIHDGARPMINQGIINDCLDRLNNYDAAIPILDSHDALINIQSLEYSNRSLIKIVQTPQGFKYKMILNAYKKFMDSDKKDNSYLKDDFSVLLKYKNSLTYTFFNGNKLNFKITDMKDLSNFKLVKQC